MDVRISIGGTAPDFTLPDLNGNAQTLSQQRGQIVVLNFWSAECPWTARIDGELVQMVERVQDVRLWSIASNVNEPPELLARAAKERNLPVVLQDEHQSVADLYGAVTTPHLFVIDPQGVLRYQGAFSDLSFRKRQAEHAYVEEAIRALQEGRDPEPAETAPYGCTIVRYA